jgi:NADPH:quinone reductase-like Zn-dependent oxidoreductase
MIRTRTWTRVRGPSSSAPQGSVRESSEDRAFALGANDVLIQVEHTAVDLHDWHQRASSTSSRSCGYVRAVGSQVTTVAQGDSVVVLRTRVPNKAADHTIEASPATPPGRPETGQDEDDAFACGLTDVMLASEDDVKIVPLGLSARELLLLMRPGLAALDATHTKLRIFPGQSVLICGASSPIAYLAIQLALVKGARVLAVVATKEEAAALSVSDSLLVAW